jgi:hypothetical protein
VRRERLTRSAHRADITDMFDHDNDPRPEPIAMHAIPRPLIVWVYVALQALSMGPKIAFDSSRDGISIPGTVWELAITAIGIIIVWRASKVGWVIWTSLGVLFLPLALVIATTGTSGAALLASQVVLLLVLVSPWMLRWIWRTPRPADLEPASA